jgi:hypothetical protein
MGPRTPLRQAPPSSVAEGSVARRCDGGHDALEIHHDLQEAFMPYNIEQRAGSRPVLSGDTQLELVRRYARILRSAPAETARFQRDRAGAPARSRWRVERPGHPMRAAEPSHDPARPTPIG